MNRHNVQKVHGSGNSFVMTGQPDQVFPASDDALRVLAVAACAPNAADTDGLLIVQRDAVGEADAEMRMFNPDGSEAEICGNGLRCVARAALDFYGRDEVTIWTMKRLHRCVRLPDMAEGVYTVSVDMGRPTFDLAEIGASFGGTAQARVLPELSTVLEFTMLGMPNPHLVAPVEIIDFEELARIGRLVNESRTLFTCGANVNFVRRMAPQAIQVATYERGVGITNACGSGMTAASIAACELGLVEPGREITVYNAGGFVKTLVGADAATDLKGNATIVWSADLYLDGDRVRLEQVEETGEETVYQRGVAQPAAEMLGSVNAG